MPKKRRKVPAVRPKTTERKLKILEAALSCFARYGFQATTTEDICKAAAISPGHLYYYYASKEELIKAVAETHLAANQSMLEHTLSMDDLLNRAVTAENIRRMQPPGIKPSFPLEVIAESDRNETLKKIVHEHSLKNEIDVDHFLQRAKDRGELKADADLPTLRIVLQMYWAAHPVLSISDPNFDDARYERTLRILLKPFLRRSKTVS